MDIIYNIIVAIIILLVSYLSGSIPNAIWIGKVFFHKDPRDYGSGNAGGTNAGRVFGKKIGVLVIFLDAAKLILPLYMFWLILSKAPINNGTPLMVDTWHTYMGSTDGYVIKWPIYWLATIGCCFGHCYPIFAGFRGGKNVSSFYGIILGSSWLLGLLPGFIFFGVLKMKKYVSLASMVSSWFAVIFAWTWSILLMSRTITGEWSWFVCYGCSLDCNWIFAICVTLNSALLTFKHIPNIKRIKDGTESKIKWMK